MDRRNELAKARDEWLDSPEALKASEPFAENVDARLALRYRLAQAFAAGWSARPCCFTGKTPPTVKKSKGVKK